MRVRAGGWGRRGVCGRAALLPLLPLGRGSRLSLLLRSGRRVGHLVARLHSRRRLPRVFRSWPAWREGSSLWIWPSIQAGPFSALGQVASARGALVDQELEAGSSRS